MDKLPHYPDITSMSGQASRRSMLKYFFATPLLPPICAIAKDTSASNASIQNALEAWANAAGLSPDMHHVRTIIADYFASTPEHASLRQQRQRADAFYLNNIPLPADLRFTDVNTRPVKGEWSTGKLTAPHKIMLYLHGGGYVLGSPKGWRPVSAVIGREAGIMTFSLAYRLAPEHPFPAALEDACTAYRWLLSMNYSARQIIIAGDSAGGGLALAVMFKLRSLGLPLPAAAFVMSPWTDLTLGGDTMDRPLEYDPYNIKADNQRNVQAYLKGGDVRNPYVSPLFGDFRGFPPGGFEKPTGFEAFCVIPFLWFWLREWRYETAWFL
ncbi:alpha/beta hydrolase [Komagataeibacter diospyri]|uniref:alpha/beta hydrolase n=1 Tax=Komagataeibacter diospyri TaxID=1932662 RepID=UPI003757BB84